MKIALITNYWKNSDGGGIKTYLVNIVDALQNRGADVSVLFRDGEDPEQFRSGSNKVAFSFACYRQLKKILPDVVHTQGTWYCLLPGVLYKKIHGCTLIHTFHTEPEKKLLLPAKMFFQSLLNACDCVTFVSKGLQERVVEVYGLSFSRTAITYGGVKVGNVTLDEVQQFMERFQVGSDSPVLLVQAFTANTLKLKGLKLVIQALKLLKNNNSYPDIILLATREGKYSDELIAFAQSEEIQDHIIFTGDVKNPFVPVEICDTFIFPWLGKSGVGLALLEAMALGKPVIVTDIGHGSEIIENGENGLLVAPEAELVADKIDFLLKNREIAESMGKCAKKTVEERFTWDLAAERFINIYGLIE